MSELFVPDCSDGPRMLPNPYDCTTYYECANGKAILLSCAPGTHFDRSLNVCNWPDFANCEQIPYPA